jgi:predicted transcriptional regulator
MRKNEEIRRQILFLFKQEVAIVDIAQRLNIKEGSCRQYLKAMVKEGLLPKQTRQEWLEKNKRLKIKRLKQQIDLPTLEKYRELNYSYSEIGKLYNLPQSILKEQFGFVPMGRMRLSQKVLELRKEGKTQKQIAEILNRHEGTIGRICHLLVKKGLLQSQKSGTKYA